MEGGDNLKSYFFRFGSCSWTRTHFFILTKMFYPFFRRGCSGLDYRSVLVDKNQESLCGSCAAILNLFINVNILSVSIFNDAFKGTESEITRLLSFIKILKSKLICFLSLEAAGLGDTSRRERKGVFRKVNVDVEVAIKKYKV